MIATYMIVIIAMATDVRSLDGGSELHREIKRDLAKLGTKIVDHVINEYLILNETIGIVNESVNSIHATLAETRPTQSDGTFSLDEARKSWKFATWEDRDWGERFDDAHASREKIYRRVDDVSEKVDRARLVAPKSGAGYTPASNRMLELTRSLQTWTDRASQYVGMNIPAKNFYRKVKKAYTDLRHEAKRQNADSLKIYKLLESLEAEMKRVERTKSYLERLLKTVYQENSKSKEDAQLIKDIKKMNKNKKDKKAGEKKSKVAEELKNIPRADLEKKDAKAKSENQAKSGAKNTVTQLSREELKIKYKEHLDKKKREARRIQREELERKKAEERTDKLTEERLKELYRDRHKWEKMKRETARKSDQENGKEDFGHEIESSIIRSEPLGGDFVVDYKVVRNKTQDDNIGTFRL